MQLDRSSTNQLESPGFRRRACGDTSVAGTLAANWTASWMPGMDRMSMLSMRRKAASKYGASRSVTLTPPTHGSVSTIGAIVMRDTARICVHLGSHHQRHLGCRICTAYHQQATAYSFTEWYAG